MGWIVWEGRGRKEVVRVGGKGGKKESEMEARGGVNGGKEKRGKVCVDGVSVTEKERGRVAWGFWSLWGE
ncbi:hypothetical protein TSUD_231790 [Trifolium subterraneum]|uniref:Uncharacterized protein n=1 Tax=Trifolium subterraneum TaxID=3900 RepID=A0A2Z6LKW8_TRISU|nr:hypothetical protein TSUD_231790 [Trifolium subterraneum]